MSLEEMDRVFEESKNLFDPPRIARELQKHRKRGERLEDIPAIKDGPAMKEDGEVERIEDKAPSQES